LCAAVLHSSWARKPAVGLLFLLIFQLLAVTGYALELSNEERAFLLKKGPIRFVSQTNYPPFECIDTDRQREGMMLDVVRWLAAEMGFQPHFQDMSFQKAQEAVLAGQADVLTSLFYSEQRTESFAFTEPLFDVPASIFVRSGRTDINGLNDLHGKTIAMQQGDYAKEFLDSQGIVCTIVATEDFTEATNRLIDGSADAIIGDEQIVFYYLASNSLPDAVKKVGLSLYVGRSSMATSRENAQLISLLNKGIAEARKTGVLDNIAGKWLGAAWGYRQSPFKQYLMPVAVSAAGLLVAVLTIWLWNIQLRTQVRAKTSIILEREQALGESERNLRTFFDTMDDLVFVGDLEGRILHTNAAVIDKLGYSRGELRTLLFLDLHPPDKRREAETIVTAMAQGKAKVCPLPLQTKSGVLLPVETRVWQGRWNGEICLFGLSKDLGKEQEALQMFNRLFAANPAPMALSTVAEGRFVEVNEAFLETIGYAREEVVGRSSAELHLFADPVRQRAIAAHLASHGRITDCELQVQCKDGTLLDGVFAGELFESQGKSFFLTVMIDQTARKQAEQALRESEEQYRRLFESMPDLFCRIDRGGVILLISPSVARMTGFAPEELIGTNIRQHTLNPEDGYRILSLIAKQGFIDDFEMAVRTKNGSRLWLSCSARISKDRDGGFNWIEGIARNITDRRQSDIALRQELAFRSSIIDNMTDGLCVFHETVDPPFERCTIWNNRMIAITGHGMEHVNRHGWLRSIFPEPEMRAKVTARMEEKRQRGDFRAEEWELTHADGRKRQVSLATSSIATEQGTTHTLALIRDISESKRAERERLRLNRELQQAQKLESLGRMAGATAHHFNNILCSVIGYLNLLQEEIPSETNAEQFLTRALHASQRAVELSHLMLRYTGQGGSNKVLRDLFGEVRYALTQIATGLPPAIELEMEVGSALLTVGVGAEDLHWLLTHLIANSVEGYGDSGGVIRITTGMADLDADRLQRTIGTPVPQPGLFAFMEVSDRGCGMDKETVTRMFDPFFSTKFVGRGLGLAIVSGIIRACRGAVFVDSYPGQGTTVRLWLPVVARAPGNEDIF
jgi:PAS domain S-box-containing protein